MRVYRGTDCLARIGNYYDRREEDERPSALRRQHMQVRRCIRLCVEYSFDACRPCVAQQHIA